MQSFNFLFFPLDFPFKFHFLRTAFLFEYLKSFVLLDTWYCIWTACFNAKQYPTQSCGTHRDCIHVWYSFIDPLEENSRQKFDISKKKKDCAWEIKVRASAEKRGQRWGRSIPLATDSPPLPLSSPIYIEPIQQWSPSNQLETHPS